LLTLKTKKNNFVPEAFSTFPLVMHNVISLLALKQKKKLGLTLGAYSSFNIFFFATIMWSYGRFSNLILKKLKDKRKVDGRIHGTYQQMSHPVVFMVTRVVRTPHYVKSWNGHIKRTKYLNIHSIS
jgi:hypothetical protein